MLSHDNIVFAAREFSKLNLWRDGEERIVTYLPLSHIAGTSHVTILTRDSLVTVTLCDDRHDA